jgi:hypothetical protein
MPRSEYGPGEHPELEILLSRASGVMAADEAVRLDAHLETCELCRLELKRAARFAALDQDEEAAAEADWNRAAVRLDEAWKQKIRPGAATVRDPRRSWRWLAPVAAAAVVALIVFNVGDSVVRNPSSTGEDTVRGTPAAAPVIQAEDPAGELAAAPHGFAWSSEREFDAYAVEVFTENLGTILRLEDLTVTRVELTDSLRGLFAPDTTYFWHVEGREGLTATEASATVWFRVVPDAAVAN